MVFGASADAMNTGPTVLPSHLHTHYRRNWLSFLRMAGKGPWKCLLWNQSYSLLNLVISKWVLKHVWGFGIAPSPGACGSVPAGGKSRPLRRTEGNFGLQESNKLYTSFTAESLNCNLGEEGERKSGKKDLLIILPVMCISFLYADSPLAVSTCFLWIFLRVFFFFFCLF